MHDQTSILVFGVDPLASATARLLFLAGYSVAIHQREAPKVARRRMSFADAWRQGKAMLDGVEARLVRSDAQFLAGLRQKSFIPLLAPPAGAVERWPWDVIVDAGGESGAGDQIGYDAQLRIGLGPGFVAGDNCDLVIAIDGPDPGAVLRKGAIKSPARAPQDRGFRESGRIIAPLSGFFSSDREIGDLVAEGEIVGNMGERLLASPRAGRLIGLRDTGAAVGAGEPVGEVDVTCAEPWNGVAKSDQALARAILLAVQMELNGWTPVALDGLV